MPPTFAFALIPRAVFFSSTIPEPTAVAGVPWLFVETGTRLPHSPGGIRSKSARPPRVLDRSLNVTRRFAFRPRIVCVGKHEPVRERRMAVQPERDEWRRIRVRKIFLSQNLKCVRRHIAGIGHNSVNHF